MSIIEAIILGVVQGLTEFIPVSSSGHLLLLHKALGISETGLGFDISLHMGTLAALILFFHKDLTQLLYQAIKGGPKRRLGFILMLATVPSILAGIWLQETAETTFRSPLLVCTALAAVALLILVAERLARRNKTRPVEEISPAQGLAVGIAQAVALVPGMSRSGSTITAGLFAGLDRVTATRFSFLLSIPVTVGAIIKVLADGNHVGLLDENLDVLIVGVLAAFLSGAFAIRFLLKFVAKHSLDVFAYYRLALAGLVVLALVVF